MVHARLGNLLEVVLGDKRLPVLGQSGAGLLFAQRLAERPLVNSSVASRIEEGRRDPWLCHQPASNVDAAECVSVEVDFGVARFQSTE